MANSSADFLYIWEVTEEFPDPEKESDGILYIAQFAFEVDAREYVDMMNAKYHPYADRYFDRDKQRYVYRRIEGKR